MKVGKIVGVVVLLIAAVVAVGLFYLFSNINPIVKRAIETKGPEITGTDVALGGVDIELFNGRAELTGFAVANPDQFNSKHLLEAQSIVFNIEPTTLRSEVIVINEVLVDGVTATVEQKGLTTNVQAVLKAIQSNLPQANDDPVKDEEGKVLRFMVEQLRFADSKVRVVTENHGEREVEIPAVEATSLGSRTAGLTAAELGVAIVQPYLERAREVAQERVRSAAEGEIKDRAKEKVREKLGEDGDKALDKVRDLF